MYDIATKTVNKLDGELSTKFVNVAEENYEAQDDELTTVTSQESAETIDRADDPLENGSNEKEEAASNIVETVVKYDEEDPFPNVKNKVLISSGYSVIKNE
jgi:hypothetical protein